MANAFPIKPFVLQRLDPASVGEFVAPRKKINDGDDLNFWLVSSAYRDLTVWLLQLNRAMFPSRHANGPTEPTILTSPLDCSVQVTAVRTIIDGLAELIAQAPPSTGPRRFGNVAFRDWFRLAEESVDALLAVQLCDLYEKWSSHSGLNDELRSYLLGSFGSAQRLDYGTGHELSFLAFLGALWKLGMFQEGEERVIVTAIVQPYLDLMRKLILTYTLEPAGSHGVWGLDDHSFAPYIFGSAQFGPAIDHSNTTAPVPTEGSLPSSPSPSDVTKPIVVRDYKDSNMYFSAIQFIYDVKKGPFWEHSPVLYDISGIKDGWGKINKGMLKMYAAEVLGKFPVVQHFSFGNIFAWQRDPHAVQQAGSLHAAQQPPISKDAVRPPPSSFRTAAPWAKTGSGGASMPAMRALWATGSTSSRQTSTDLSLPSTTAPWAQGRGERGPVASTSASRTIPSSLAASRGPSGSAQGDGRPR